MSSKQLLYLEIDVFDKYIDAPCMSFQDLNLAVVGSQIVGLVPLKAMMDTADYYMEEENLFILEEDQKLRLVWTFLTLNIQII